MMNRPLRNVHGHTIKELEFLLQDTCDIFDEEVVLERNALGGWSSINIRGQSSGLDFVLKLSGSISSYDIGPFAQLKEVSLFFNKLGIAPLPLALDQLPDATETPFIIMEYVDGIVHESLNDFTSEETAILKKCLQTLSEQEPPTLKKYDSPSDHLNRAYDLVVNHPSFSNRSQEVAELVDSFEELYSKVLAHTDSLGSWSSEIMHGDLWVPNLVFQPEKVVLLDFEACAYGSPYFDLTYMLETPEGITETYIAGLMSPEDVDEVDALRPLVVSFIVNWSLERLLSMEAGFIEPNLSTPKSRSAIIGYTRSKLSRLRTLLSN